MRFHVEAIRMPWITRLRFLVPVVVLFISAVGAEAAPETRDVPETVLVTYQARPGADAALASVIEKHWNVARKMNLVLPHHVVVRGGEEGKRYFVEIFTWRDGSIPDFAPDEITRLWSEMNRLVEDRDGRPGIDFSPVTVLNLN